MSWAVAAGLILISISACGPTGRSQPAGASAGSPPAGHAGPSSSGQPVMWRATLKDNHHTQAMSVGDSLRLELPTTFWTIRPLAPSAAVVLRTGATTVQTSTPCIPGGGCGTTTAQYQATRAGRVTLTADRTLCGEARRCTGGDGTYLLTIVVR